MNNVINNLLSNLSISDIIAFLSMIAAIIAAGFAWRKQQKASKSEELAERYARNADEANQSAKKYYDEIYKYIEKQGDNLKKEEIKTKILIVLESGYPATTDQIAEKVGMDSSSVEAILYELKVELKISSFGHNPIKWKIKGVETKEEKIQK